MRLNGWQRIGVVASVAWAVAGLCWGYSIGSHEGDYTRDYFERCKDTAYNEFRNQSHTPKSAMKTLESDLATCRIDENKRHEQATSNQIPYALMMGLLPIPLGWFGVYGGLALIRWVRKGFAETSGHR